MQKIDIRKVEMGIRFRVFRELINLSIQELAQQLGTSQTIIEDYEEGRAYPDILVLHFLYEHHGLNINWSMGRMGEMFNEKAPEKLKKLFTPNLIDGKNPNRLDELIELFELMEIPKIEESIMASLLEVKTQLQKQVMALKPNLEG